VQLISIDGLVLIGPGSQWFWTAMSGTSSTLTRVVFRLDVNRWRGI